MCGMIDMRVKIKMIKLREEFNLVKEIILKTIKN